VALSLHPQMRITCSYRGDDKVWETPEAEVVFGRAEGNWPVVLDLSPDPRVSRLHGRIWEEDGSCWIEDLNSSRGTLLNGVEIKGRGKQRFGPADSAVAGQTTLRVEIGELREVAGTNYLEHGTILLPEMLRPAWASPRIWTQRPLNQCRLMVRKIPAHGDRKWFAICHFNLPQKPR
jgi:hypothetical protein